MSTKISSNPILKDCVVGIAGYLGDYAWREEKVEQWVTYWGGQFTHMIDGNVTHLLCTEEDFKKRTALVRAALRNKDTKIVLRDWLEDSIWKKTRLRTLPYDLGAKDKEEAAKKQKVKKMEKCSSNAENYVDERFWHPYRDSTYFEYQIQLKRNDEESGNVGEKHLLTLWESNAKPFTYQCTTLFTRKNKSSRCPLNESPVNFDTAFKTFKAFFKKKTTLAWDERIKKMASTGQEHFQYTPPGGGKPVGLVNGDGNGDDSHKDNHTTTSDSQIENQARQNGGQAEETNGPTKASLKHGRPQDDDSDSQDEEQPTKKFRRESSTDSHIESTIIVGGGEEPEGDAQDAQDDDEISGDDESDDGDDDDDDSMKAFLRSYRTESNGVVAPCTTPVETDAESEDGDINDSGADADADADADVDNEQDPPENDEATAREIERMYDGVLEAELGYSSISEDEHEHEHEQHESNGVGECGDGRNEDSDRDSFITGPSPLSDYGRYFRSARATAIAIHRERARGTLNVRDNQAAQIAAVRARLVSFHAGAFLHARVSASLVALGAEVEDDDDSDSNETYDSESDSRLRCG